MITTEIIIDDEIAKLAPPLSTEERVLLEKNLLEDGCRDPLVIWQETGILIDGHNRHKICDDEGIEFDTVEMSFTDLNAVKLWIVNNQFGRRNLSSYQRAELALTAKEIVEAEAKRRQRSAGGDRKSIESQKSLVQISAPPISSKEVSSKKTKGKSRSILARRAELSHATIDQASYIKDHADESTKNQLRKGNLTINKVYKNLKRNEIKKQTQAKLAEIETKEPGELDGVYDVLVIDPPWPMQKIDRDVAPNQTGFDYPTMSEDELSTLEIPTADNAHVWLWTTHKFLPMAQRLLKTWGLKYVCNFVWHKPGGFQPFGLPQYNCEFALYARKGSPEFCDLRAFATCFNAPRGKHSEKPEEFYDMVRRVTSGRRLDMFNRRRIEGFDGWGKEAAVNV